jgi:hypothetical protein
VRSWIIGRIDGSLAWPDAACLQLSPAWTTSHCFCARGRARTEEAHGILVQELTQGFYSGHLPDVLAALKRQGPWPGWFPSPLLKQSNVFLFSDIYPSMLLKQCTTNISQASHVIRKIRTIGSSDLRSRLSHVTRNSIL